LDDFLVAADSGSGECSEWIGEGWIEGCWIFSSGASSKLIVAEEAKRCVGVMRNSSPGGGRTFRGAASDDSRDSCNRSGSL